MFINYLMKGDDFTISRDFFFGHLPNFKVFALLMSYLINKMYE